MTGVYGVSKEKAWDIATRPLANQRLKKNDDLLITICVTYFAATLWLEETLTLEAITIAVP